MTLSEYSAYSNITRNIFNYMNGRINPYNICKLNIATYSVNGYNGFIKYPNLITIYIGTILDGWENEYLDQGINKIDFCCTYIAWVVAHELFHSEQTMNVFNYSNNIEYKNIRENDVNRISWNWVNDHKEEISKLFDFNCIIGSLTISDLPKETAYAKVSSLKEFYLQNILNIGGTVYCDLTAKITEAMDKYKNIGFEVNLCNKFCRGVWIKENNEFLLDSIKPFTDIIDEFCSPYSTFKIQRKISVLDNDESTAFIEINIADPVIEPMQFYK